MWCLPRNSLNACLHRQRDLWKQVWIHGMLVMSVLADWLLSYLPPDLGPVNIHERVLRAMDRPSYNHRDPWFPPFFSAILQDLKMIFGTTKGTTFIYPGTGTGCWESALTNTLSPGDKVYHLSARISSGDLLCHCVFMSCLGQLATPQRENNQLGTIATPKAVQWMGSTTWTLRALPETTGRTSRWTLCGVESSIMLVMWEAQLFPLGKGWGV
jgi:hypothetical protein